LAFLDVIGDALATVAFAGARFIGTVARGQVFFLNAVHGVSSVPRCQLSKFWKE